MIDAIVKISGSIFVAGIGLVGIIMGVLAIAVIIYTIKDYINKP